MKHQEISNLIYKIGFVLATVISFTLNKSVWWALLHGALSCLYVIYFLIFK